MPGKEYKPFKMKAAAFGNSPMKKNYPQVFGDQQSDLRSQVVDKAVDELMNGQTPMMKKTDPNMKQKIKNVRAQIDAEFNKKPRNDKKITELQRKLDDLIDIDAGYGPGNRPTPGDEERAPTKKKDEHNIHARRTEGSKFRQKLRKKFGKNRPRKY
jgi:hypothetical protein